MYERDGKSADQAQPVDGPEAGPVDVLLAAVARFRARPRDGREPVAVCQELIALRQACDLLELECARDAGELAASSEPQCSAWPAMPT